jgi:hypothetical protein
MVSKKLTYFPKKKQKQAALNAKEMQTGRYTPANSRHLIE